MRSLAESDMAVQKSFQEIDLPEFGTMHRFELNPILTRLPG